MSKYIKVEDLQAFCDNQKDHCITPNDFQRFNTIEIKEPHGDLVDRQKLIKELSKAWDVDDDQDFANKSVWRIVEKEAPTIIEASTSPTGFCNTEGCSNSKPDMSKAQNHICPYYQGVCSLHEYIICYCQHHYEMCDKFIVASKETDNE